MQKFACQCLELELRKFIFEPYFTLGPIRTKEIKWKAKREGEKNRRIKRKRKDQMKVIKLQTRIFRETHKDGRKIVN
jgi:hypothetical protein